MAGVLYKLDIVKGLKGLLLPKKVCHYRWSINDSPSKLLAPFTLSLCWSDNIYFMPQRGDN